MSLYTICISRNLSVRSTNSTDAPNGKAVGDVIQLLEGDVISELNKSEIQKKIFYFKTVVLTDIQYKEINDALFDVSKKVSLNCFSSDEIEQLKNIGVIADEIGGNITYNNFIITDK